MPGREPCAFSADGRAPAHYQEGPALRFILILIFVHILLPLLPLPLVMLLIPTALLIPRATDPARATNQHPRATQVDGRLPNRGSAVAVEGVRVEDLPAPQVFPLVARELDFVCGFFPALPNG